MPEDLLPRRGNNIQHLQRKTQVKQLGGAGRNQESGMSLRISLCNPASLSKGLPLLLLLAGLFVLKRAPLPGQRKPALAPGHIFKP